MEIKIEGNLDDYFANMERIEAAQIADLLEQRFKVELIIQWRKMFGEWAVKKFSQGLGQLPKQ